MSKYEISKNFKKLDSIKLLMGLQNQEKVLVDLKDIPSNA